MKSYSTAEVARLLGLSDAQVRSFARLGVLTPERDARRAYRFSFQDLVLLRAAAGLAQAHVPTVRIRRALVRLKRQLPSGRSLSEVRITAQGDDVLVSDGGSPWSPASGQYQLDFEVAELGARVAPLAGRAAREARLEADLDANDWFALAVDLEAYAPAEAIEAYRAALELAPDLPDAHVNLGRLLHEAGDAAEAENHYRRALERAPAHALAAYNLGVVLEDLGRPLEAVRAYETAIRADPSHADASFNLARIFETIGDSTAAIRHLSRYRRLTAG